MAVDRRFRRGDTATVTAALSGGRLLDGDPIFDRQANAFYVGKGPDINGVADQMVKLPTFAEVAPTINAIVKVSSYGYDLKYANTAAQNRAGLLALLTDAQSQKKTALVRADQYAYAGLDLSGMNNVRIELEAGTEMVNTAAAYGLTVRGLLGTTYPITPVGQGSYLVTVQGGTWTPGAWVFLQSDDRWSNARMADYATNGNSYDYNGEQVQVLGVDDLGGGSSRLHLFGPLAYDYLTNPRISAPQYAQNARITGGSWTVQSMTTSLGYHMIDLRLTQDAVVEGLTVHDVPLGGVSGTSNVRAQYNDLILRDLPNDPSAVSGGSGTGFYGYGIVVQGAETAYSVSNAAVNRARHGFTTTGDFGNVTNHRGIPRAGRINGMTLIGCTNSAFDTHSQGDGLIVTSLSISNSVRAISNRATNVTIDGFEVSGSWGDAISWYPSATNVWIKNGTVSDMIPTRTQGEATPVNGWADGLGDGISLYNDPTYGTPVGCGVEGVIFDGVGRHAVRLGAVQGLTLRRIRAQNGPADAFRLTGDCSNTVLEDCEAIGNNGVGFNVQADNITISNPRARNNQGTGIYLNGKGVRLNMRPGALSGNELGQADASQRRDLYTFGDVTGLSLSGQPPERFTDNGEMLLSLPNAVPAGFQLFGATPPTFAFQNGSQYLSGFARRMTAVTGSGVGFERYLVPGVVYVAVVRAGVVSGTWSLNVQGPRDAGLNYTLNYASVTTTDLTSADAGYALAAFTVPSAGSWRVALVCNTDGVVDVNGLDLRTGIQPAFRFVPLSSSVLAGVNTWTQAQTFNAFGSFKAGVSADVMYVSKAAGNHRRVLFQTNGTTRFGINVNADAEAGSNAGSNLNVERYSDAGALLDVPLQVNRQTGVVQVIGTYTQPFRLGGYRLWVEAATGKLRIKSSDATSDSDGTVIGTQA